MQPFDGGGDRAPVAAPVDQADVGQRVGGDDFLRTLAEVADLGQTEGQRHGLAGAARVVDAFDPGAVGAVDIARGDATDGPGERAAEPPARGDLGAQRVHQAYIICTQTIRRA